MGVKGNKIAAVAPQELHTITLVGETNYPVILVCSCLFIEDKDGLFNTGVGACALMRNDLVKIFRQRNRAERIKLWRPCWIKGHDGGNR